MAKPRIPSQKNNYAKLNQRLAGYVEQIKAIYDDLNKRASSMALSVGFSEGEFLFSNYPELKERLFNLQKQFVNDIGANIYSNTSKEWKNSNLVQDLLARKVLSFYTATAHGKEYEKYFETNSDALKAFQKRKVNGMNLSAKLWNQAESYKAGLETAISTAIRKGTSAITLSKRVSQYLNDFPSLQADYTDKFGHAAKAKDCQYASIRLARSEINMAYRIAEQARWRQFDFILGYEIKLSKKHPAPDICDDLVGKYPKDFEWTGWHPNDMCYAIPIIASDDEYWSDKPLQYVDSVPDGFKDWVLNNQPRITQAEKRGTLPYFLKDNMDVVRKMAQPFAMTDKERDELIGRGFNDFDVKVYNKSAMKGFDLLSFDKFMDDIGDKYSIYWRRKSFHPFSNSYVELVYNGDYTNKEGEIEKVILRRSFLFDDGKRVVDHDTFTLPNELQGKGISKAIFRQLFSNYERMGIDRVEVCANISVGGYCWGRYGFSAKTSEIKMLVQRRRFDAHAITQQQYEEVVGILQSAGEDIRMDMLANLEYGKKLLLGRDVEWRGWIDLHNKEQMHHLHRYLGVSD